MIYVKLNSIYFIVSPLLTMNRECVINNSDYKNKIY